MYSRKPKVGDLVYSNFGMGVIAKCHKGLFGDYETAYEVDYFEKGYKYSRLKDFNYYI